MTFLPPLLQVPLTAIVCAMLLIYLGWGINALTWRTTAHRRLAVAPIVGLGYLTLWGWWSFRMGFSLGVPNCMLMLLPPTLLNFCALRQGRLSVRSAVPAAKLYSTFIVSGVLLFLIACIPIIQDPGNLIVTLGNNDLAHHTAISRFLQESNWKTPYGFASQYPDGFIGFSNYTYFGYYALMAVCATVMGCYPHEVASGILFVIPPLTLLPLHLLLHDVLRVPRKSATIWSSLAVVNGLTFYLIYNGFGAQMLGTMSAIYLIYIGWRFHLHPQEGANWWSLCVPTLTIVALLMVYQHMLPFVGVFLICAPLAAFLARNRRSFLAPTLKHLGLAALITLILVPGRWEALYMWLFNAAKSDSGWSVAFLLPDYLVGLVGASYSQVNVGSTAFPLRYFVIALLVACLGIGAVVGLIRGHSRPLLLLASCLVVYVGAFILARRDAAQILGGYHSFKLLSFFSPLFTVLVGWAWSEARTYNRPLKLAALPFLLGFIFYDALSIRMIQGGLAQGDRLPAFASKLLVLDRRLGETSINVVSNDYWKLLWLHYFFLDKQLFSSTTTYYPKSVLSAPITLTEIPPKFFEIAPSPGETVTWDLVLTRDSGFLGASFGNGWHGAEENLVWMGAGGTSADIEFWVGSSIQQLQVDLDLAPLLPDNSYRVFWNGRALPNATSSGSISITIPEIETRENVLRIESRLPPQAPGNGDERPLSFALRKCKVKTTSVR